MLTRRQLTYMLMGLVVLASTRSTGANPGDQNVTSAGVSLEGPLSRDVFRALVGEKFSLLLDNRAATLVLLKVEDAARPDDHQFVSGTYRVAHAIAGTTLIYLRPRGRDDRYNYYEAPFNLLPENAPVTGPPPVRQPRRFERPLYEPRR